MERNVKRTTLVNLYGNNIILHRAWKFIIGVGYYFHMKYKSVFMNFI